MCFAGISWWGGGGEATKTLPGTTPPVFVEWCNVFLAFDQETAQTLWPPTHCEAHILTPMPFKYRILWPPSQGCGDHCTNRKRRHSVINSLESSATLLPAARPFNCGLALLLQWSLSSPVMGTFFYIQYLLQGEGLLSCSGLLPWVHLPVTYA